MIQYTKTMEVITKRTVIRWQNKLCLLLLRPVRRICLVILRLFIDIVTEQQLSSVFTAKKYQLCTQINVQEGNPFKYYIGFSK